MQDSIRAMTLMNPSQEMLRFALATLQCRAQVLLTTDSILSKINEIRAIHIPHCKHTMGWRSANMLGTYDLVSFIVASAVVLIRSCVD